MVLIRRVTGHSMLPKLRPGDLVIARQWPLRPKVGQVVIIRHEGLEKIKRITGVDALQVYVEGDNPVGSKDSRHFGWLDSSVVQGVVVWPRC